MQIIIIICSLLLLAYFFDLTSSYTKIPSVILLFLLGWAVKQVTMFLEIQIPDLSSLLPLFGTIGLILIVLEGSLELEFNRSKYPLLIKSFLVAFIPMLLLSLLIAFTFEYLEQGSFINCLTNAIPLSVISSAIAIPSVKNLLNYNKEFVIYESSLSDILGVLLFNFLVLNETINLYSFSHFGLQILIICIVSFIASIGLAIMLSKIDHHIKFAPIIILVILIYAISKIYHLPALIFILFFGLFIGNLDELKHLKWIKKLKPDMLNKEVYRFKEIVIEGAFLIRTLFFLLFGYLIETNDILNIETFTFAIGIVFGILIIRLIILKLFKLPVSPLLYIAPRGLITILLFLSILPSQSIPLVNKSLIIQVIILTAIVMMLGLMINKKDKNLK